MAEDKDEIDLNELDSIDALLEEAEQALDEAEPEMTEEAPDPPEAEPEPEVKTQAEPSVQETETAPAQAPASEETPVPSPEPTPDVTSEPAEDDKAAEEVPVEAGDAASAPSPPQAVKAVEDEDAPLPAEMKRPGSKKNSNSELTDADMDKLKKLILAFGISLIVMVLVGWGLSIWAAIAASTTHLDEDTMTLLEEIKTGVEHVAVKSEKQDKTLVAVERKIDALSFQLEQLNGDLGKLESLLEKGGAQPVAAHAPESVHGAPAHGHETGGGHGPAAAQATHAMPAAPVVASLDPDVKKTLGSINSRLIRTQKKVEQVYSRLLRLQAQYRAMLAALRKVEKGLKAAKKPDKKKQALRQPYYQYRAPAGEYPFDPTHVDSYP